jgi:threonine aldolase
LTRPELRQQCHTFISADRPRSAAEDFSAMAAWCETHQVAHDTYGEGELIQDFEKKIADLLGLEAGVFVITGTLTQVTALRLACEARGSRLVALHPTSHIVRHEHSNYQLLDHFKVLQVGDLHRPWTIDDLKAWPDKFGAASYELPMREIGGQLPAWDALDAIKTHCREQGIHLHMDGARLWEAAAGYGRSLSQIAEGFDSIYVSFYKGIGGMGGAMLLGTRDFVAKAQMWMKRQGGNVYQRSPYVVAAAMRLDARLAAMPAYLRRTEWLYDVLRDYPQLTPNPARPQTNMVHVYLPVSRERLTAIRDQMAEQHGIWLFGRASHAALPNQSYIEWYIGENLLALPDARVREILDLLAVALAHDE